jgi:hypothetical protein
LSTVIASSRPFNGISSLLEATPYYIDKWDYTGEEDYPGGNTSNARNPKNPKWMRSALKVPVPSMFLTKSTLLIYRIWGWT